MTTMSDQAVEVAIDTACRTLRLPMSRSATWGFTCNVSSPKPTSGRETQPERGGRGSGRHDSWTGRPAMTSPLFGVQ